MDIWLKNIPRKAGKGSKAAQSPSVAGKVLSDNFGGSGQTQINGALEGVSDKAGQKPQDTLNIAGKEVPNIKGMMLSDSFGGSGKAKIPGVLQDSFGKDAQNTIGGGKVFRTLTSQNIEVKATLAAKPNKAAKANTAQESQPMPPAYTSGDIIYQLPVAIEHITGLRIEQTINDHVIISLTGRAPDTLEAADIEKVGEGALIELSLPGQSTPFFTGCCTAISLQYQAGFRTVEIEGKSWTYELDIVKKCRSFQKLNISYEEFMAEVLCDYQEKGYINALSDSKSYKQFVVQYYETEWELLKRIAAREGTVLVPEYNKTGQKPSFWLGLPQISAEPLHVPAAKSACRDYQNYGELAANLDESAQEKDFVTYEMESYAFFPLGQKVEYEGKTLTVVKCITELKKELIQNTYTLAYSEKIALASPENTNIKGVALAGKVLNSRGVNSKVHLDIDKTQEEATARWFPYANETGNVFYCMPHNGESIHLYFKDGYEDNAIAINGARKNGGSCQKTSDYNNRYFTNHERKELFLSPDTVSFTADESAADKITIKMNDQGGILIESAKDICLNASKDISFEADDSIIMESAKAPAEAGGSA